MSSDHTLHAPSPVRRREVPIDLEARVADWEIAPGRSVAAWTYEGSVPGPTVEAEVGDELVVEVTNELPSCGTLAARAWVRSTASMPGSASRASTDRAPGLHLAP